MLSRACLKLNFGAFYFASKINMLPVVIDRHTGKMSRQKSIWRRIWFKFWQFAGMCHALHIMFRLVYSSMILGKSDLHHIPLLCFASCTYSTTPIALSILFDRYGDLNVKLFNELFNFHERVSWKLRHGPKAPREKLLCNLPHLVYSLLVSYPLIYSFDREIPHLLIHCFPERWQNWFTLLLCLTGNQLMHLFFLVFWNYTAFFIMAFIMTIQSNCVRDANAVSHIGEPLVFRIKRAYERLRHCTLSLHLFNLTFCKVIFMLKLVSLSLAILGGFAAIRLAETNIPYTIIYTICLNNGMTLYVGMFNRAFQVTDRILDFKNAIRIQSQRLMSLEQRAECKSVLQSIPRQGIKVGEFHTLERESTCIFVDFVTNQIVSLLLTFT